MERKTFITSVLLTLLLFATAGVTADGLLEGERWLTWSDETRIGYVTGFLWGFEQGYFQGCEVGEKTYSTKVSGLPGEKCIAKIPNHLKTPGEYAEIITRYYRSYPDDRNVHVLSLLVGLQSNPDLTIQEIHKTYPSSAKRPQGGE